MSWARIMAPLSGGQGDKSTLAAALALAEPFGAELSGVYGQISDELSSQYTVGYTSRNPKRDGSWRRVVVRTTRPSMTTRTKMGYFAPTVH